MEGWILLGVIALWIVGFIVVIAGAIDRSDNVCTIGGIMCLVGCALLVLQIYASSKCNKELWVREDPYVVHTVMVLSDGNEVNGQIRGDRYCMSGYINEKYTYVYGYKTAGGGMKIQKAGADTTTVYFRDDITPCAKWYKETRTFWWVTRSRYTCDVYVPTDSLQAGITIDLQ